MTFGSYLTLKGENIFIPSKQIESRNILQKTISLAKHLTLEPCVGAIKLLAFPIRTSDPLISWLFSRLKWEMYRIFRQFVRNLLLIFNPKFIYQMPVIYFSLANYYYYQRPLRLNPYVVQINAYLTFNYWFIWNKAITPSNVAVG